jgi:cysteine desulfurase
MLHRGVDEATYTSGGSESNNYAVKRAALARRQKGNHIIASWVQHQAIMEVCRYLESKGFRVTVLPVDGYGLFGPEEVEREITPATTLIAVMHANNEVGTVQPRREIADVGDKVIGYNGSLFHGGCHRLQAPE